MQRASAKHRALGRSIVELEARDPPHLKLPPPANSVPIAGQLASPLLGNGAGGGSQPSTSPNPPPAPIPVAGNGGNGGDGGGSTPTPTASPTSGGGAVVSPESIVPSPTSPTSASGNPSGSSSAGHASNSGSTASPSSSGGGGNFLSTGGQSVPVNAGPVSSTATSAALGVATPGVLAMSSSSASQYSPGSSSNTVGAASPSPTITTLAAVSSGKQLSAGAIAGITIVCLLSLLAFILLVVRRRSIAGRVELRRRWWFGHYGSDGNFSFVNSGSLHSPVPPGGEAPASRLSSRSSFATNFDHGLMLRVDSPSTLFVPEFPPMAEVRERNSVLISTGGAIARRESMNSMLSNGSEPDAQYLTVPGQDDLEPLTPMSVRPFSPSESFVFPKPPAPPPSTADALFLAGTQGPVSFRASATFVHLSTHSHAFTTDFPPAPVSTPSLYPQASTSSVSFSPFVVAANPSVDPFADPEKPGFADVEVIRRPFNPSLDDELTVCPGDRVRLLQTFDDGWASVEKLADTEGECHERGLIPVDCLREASQALPIFLTQKRVSTYGPEQLIATAL